MVQPLSGDAGTKGLRQALGEIDGTGRVTPPRHTFTILAGCYAHTGAESICPEQPVLNSPEARPRLERVPDSLERRGPLLSASSTSFPPRSRPSPVGPLLLFLK